MLKIDATARIQGRTRASPGAPEPASAPDIRDARRYTTPVFDVAVLGSRARTLNWSAGGLLLGRFGGTLAAREVIPLVLRSPKDDGTFMPAAARVVWFKQPTGLLALKFENVALPWTTWLLSHRSLL